MLNRKNVLVLNDEPGMIDRRITHQLEVLADLGYDVTFVKPAGTNTGNNEFETVDGYQLAHLYSGSAETLAKLETQIQGNIYISEEESAAIRGKLSHNKLLRYVQLTLVSLTNHRLFLALVRNRMPKSKKILGRWFEPLVLAAGLKFVALVNLYSLWRTKRQLQLGSVNPSAKEVIKVMGDKKFSYIHAHDLPILEEALVLAKHYKAKLIYDAHEIYSGQFNFDKRRQKQEQTKELRLISSVDALISVNDYCLDYIQKRNGPAEIAEVVTNCVKLPNTMNDGKNERLWHEHFDLADDVRIIVFQGGINPLRSIDELVEALPLINGNIHIGFITLKKDVKYYEEMARTLGVENRVHFIVEIDWREVIGYLQCADFGIIPYKVTSDNAYAATPNKMYEFVAAKLPVIAGRNLPQVRSFIEGHGIGFCFDFSDAASYAHAITKSFEWKEAKNAALSDSLQKAADIYDYSTEAAQLERIYARLAN